MAFLTLSAANRFNSNTFCAIHFSALQVLVVFLVNAIETIVFKLHLCFAVTVDTPAHAQVCKLFYFTHFLDLTVAGLTSHLACFYVL